MPRILALDYGLKRTGIAETDDLQLIASARETVLTDQLWTYLKQYLASHQVQALVVGLPVELDGRLAPIEIQIRSFIEKFSKSYPNIEIIRVNEQFTSKLALDAMIAAGSSKKDRRTKGNLDKISATIILQQFLETKRNAK